MIPVMYVTLNSDNLIQCVTIQITNDNIKEVAETLTLSLTTDADNVLFVNNSIAVNIISDDGESRLHIVLHDLFTHLSNSLSISYQSIYQSIYMYLSFTHAVAEFFFVNETMIEIDESIESITLCTELGGAALSQNITIQLMDTPSTTAQR